MNHPKKAALRACIFGLLGQPFWFYASWQAGQWGIFAVSIVYMAAWLRGLCRHRAPVRAPAGLRSRWWAPGSC